jgi:aspartokinase-like uncharacterized kinase
VTWVVKLGGSMLDSPELKHWLDMFARHSDGQIVIVPGGGLFADAVREAQYITGVDDQTAHKMAVVAMDQYGMLMTGLNHDLVTASTELEIAERGWQHRAIVWLPSHMVCGDDSIPASWHVTSDSLAAWLAARLNAKHLVLVKSARPDVEQISLERLIKDGFVDRTFGDYVAGQNFETWILGKQDHAAFTEKISDERLQEIGLQVRCAWN